MSRILKIDPGRQPDRAGGPGLRLSAPDGRAGQADPGPRKAGGGLLCLPCAVHRRRFRALHYLPQARRHRPADDGRPAHCQTADLDALPPETDQPGLRRLPQRSCRGEALPADQGISIIALLEKATRDECQSCHKSPKDSLHQQITGNCSQCHSQDKWTPATFDHDKYFELDRDHNARCVTCHVRNDYSRYTCYGCHEHTPENIRRKHIEEGIRDFDNCVECHRNADEHDIRGPYGKREGKRERKLEGKKHDD